MDDIAEHILKRFQKAGERRTPWETYWRECYGYVLPTREGFQDSVGSRKSDLLFNGTAADAAEQLAASLMAQLTPPWTRWFSLTAGHALTPEEQNALTPVLDRAAEVVQFHMDRSNFAVEMHQCFLDLVVGGTASLLFEEAGLGEASAFRFTAVPLADLVLEEGPEGRLDVTFRRCRFTLPALRKHYPDAVLPDDLER